MMTLCSTRPVGCVLSIIIRFFPLFQRSLQTSFSFWLIIQESFCLNCVISHFDNMFFQISSVKNVYNISQWKCALYMNRQVAKVKNSSRKFVGVLYPEISWNRTLGVVNRLKAGQPSHHSFSGSGKRFSLLQSIQTSCSAHHWVPGVFPLDKVVRNMKVPLTCIYI